MNNQMSFDDSQREIPIASGGIPAVTEWGQLGRILRSATLAEIQAEGWDIFNVLKEDENNLNERLYLFECKNGRPNEYIWRENLFPVPLEEP